MAVQNKIFINILSLITAVFIVLCFSGCNNKENVVLHDNIVSFSNFPEEKNIVFEKLSEYKAGNPRILHLIDSTMIIFNYGKNTESYFYNFYLTNNSFSEGYLKKGRGPTEAFGGYCTGIVGNNIWVYDVTLKKILMLDKTAALNGEIKLIDSYPVKDNYYQIAFIDSSKYFACGKVDSRYKIQEIDLLGTILNEYGEFKYVPSNIPLDALKDAYHSFFYIKPSGDKMALAYLYTDVLEIYNLKEQFSNIAIQGPANIELNFKVGERNNYNYMEKNENIRKTFLAGAVTDEYIYLAYSGVSYAEKEKINNCYSIFIYDWSGNPVKKLNFNTPILSLVVSKDNKTIYSFSLDEGFIVKAQI